MVFQFFSDQFGKYKFVCECYDMVVFENRRIKINENITNIAKNTFFEEGELKNTEKSMSKLIERVCIIVEIKINELKKCKSGQKRNLILHFTEEFLNFKHEIKEKYNVDLNIMELSEAVVEV